MLVKTDDNLYRVDRTYLGPKVLRFPWRATYRDYGVWLGLMLLSGLVAWKIGVPANFLTVCLWPLAVARTTQAISRALDHDRPLREAMVRLGQELTAKRPGDPTEAVETIRLSARRWRYGAEPDQRRLTRCWLAVVATAAAAVEWVRQTPSRFRRAEREDLAADDPELAAELVAVEGFADPDGPPLELIDQLSRNVLGGPDETTDQNPWIAAAAQWRRDPEDTENNDEAQP